MSRYVNYIKTILGTLVLSLTLTISSYSIANESLNDICLNKDSDNSFSKMIMCSLNDEALNKVKSNLKDKNISLTYDEVIRTSESITFKNLGVSEKSKKIHQDVRIATTSLVKEGESVSLKMKGADAVFVKGENVYEKTREISDIEVILNSKNDILTINIESISNSKESKKMTADFIESALNESLKKHNKEKVYINEELKKMILEWPYFGVSGKTKVKVKVALSKKGDLSIHMEYLDMDGDSLIKLKVHGSAPINENMILATQSDNKVLSKMAIKDTIMAMMSFEIDSLYIEINPESKSFKKNQLRLINKIIHPLHVVSEEEVKSISNTEGNKVPDGRISIAKILAGHQTDIETLEVNLKSRASIVNIVQYKDQMNSSDFFNLIEVKINDTSLNYEEFVELFRTFGMDIEELKSKDYIIKAPSL